jgi:hypothetical protein
MKERNEEREKRRDNKKEVKRQRQSREGINTCERS